MSPRPRNTAFSLIEVLVSMAVLALLILIVAQIMSGATRTTGISRQHLDSDSEARAVFDRMANDFAHIVNRTDVDFLFSRNGNASFYFYSEAPAVTSATATAANPAQPVALIGYRINADYQLERLGRGLTWDGAPPDGVVFLTYPAPTVPNPTPDPDPQSTLAGSPFGQVISAPSPGSSYHVLGSNVFRLEFSFLLKPYISENGGTLVPAAYSENPWNDNHKTSEEHYRAGLGDVQAIIVTLALLDERSRKLVNDSAVFASVINGSFNAGATASQLPAEQWQQKIGNLASPEIPAAAAAQIRIYQRTFFLNSGVPQS